MVDGSYLDVLDATGLDGVEPPVFEHAGSIGRDGDGGAVFVFELRALENLEGR